MKKGLIIVAALGLLAVVSCKKDHTCACTVSADGLSITVDTTFADMKKKDAVAECDKGDATLTVGGDTWTTECELK
jgi:hypothetical protein